jgi:predicted nucleic acid-binding protein
MKRLLVDINIVLDVLLDREPHVQASAALWNAVENGVVQGLLSAHALTTVHYLIRKELGDAFAHKAIAELRQVFDVAPIDGGVILRATRMPSPDFEDSVTAAAAEKAKCFAIVTRDPAGFRKTGVRALTPEGAAALWRPNGKSG